jgi:hypothetical protein
VSSSEAEEESIKGSDTDGSNGEEVGVEKSKPYPGKVYEGLTLAYTDPQGVDLSRLRVDECTPIDPGLVPEVAGKVRASRCVSQRDS